MQRAMTELGSARAPARARLRSRTWMAWLPLVPLVVLLLVFLVYPVGTLLLQSVKSSAGFSAANYVRLFTTDVYLRVLGITFKIAGLTAVLCVVLSYPVAYLIATCAPRSRARLMFWVLLPFWTSFLVRTFAWIILLGRNGAINQWLQGLGIMNAPAHLIYNFGAVLVGMTHALVPLCIFTMVSVMENIDMRLPQAALTLGARPGSVFWVVYFPMSLPGVAAAGLMVFITALAFFITPAFLGGPRETMLTQLIIQQVQDLMSWGFAGALSMLLLVATLIVFTIYDRVVGLSTLAGAAPSAGKRQAGNGHGSWGGRLARGVLVWLGRLTDALLAVLGVLPWLVARVAGRSRLPRVQSRRHGLWIVAVLVLVYLVLPAFIMVPISFTQAGVIDWPPRGFSLEWYRMFLHSAQWTDAFVRSFGVALGTAALSMAIGTPAAFALIRGTLRGKSVVLAASLAPLIIPRMIIAIGLFYFYARIGLVGTSLGLVLGHTLLAVPYVVVTLMAVLKNYDVRLDHAAWSLGANRWRALWHVTFPLIKVGMISSFLFAFITSFDELTIALFTTNGLTTTLPKQMWDDATLKVTPTIAAVSTILLVIVTLIILGTEALKNRESRVRG